MEFERAREKQKFVKQVTDQETLPQPEESNDSAAKEPEWEEEVWEERFGDHTDPNRRGPMAIALDVGFPGAQEAYGLAEHTTPLALPTTRGQNPLNPNQKSYTEPYRMYNLDVFEYDLDTPAAIYGAVPLLHALRSGGRVASAFWMNAAETWVDVTKQPLLESPSRSVQIDSHWMSETGVIDLFLFPGPDFQTNLDAYTQITGRPMLPPMFSVAYHQCRWNYNDQKDVQHVDQTFDLHAIPYDVLWLDIEHTDGKRYWTWDLSKFPDPTDMQLDLGRKGRKMVTIVDPHIKIDEDYAVYAEAKKRGLFVKNADGQSDFDGWCWPGGSSYIDFLNPESMKFIEERYKFGTHPHATEFLHIWNDMNEPSVFNGPEITMQKDLMHYGGWEHRDVHNLYGFLYVYRLY